MHPARPADPQTRRPAKYTEPRRSALAVREDFVHGVDYGIDIG